MTRALTSTEFAARSGKGDGTGRPIVVVDTMYSDEWVGCFSGSHARMPFARTRLEYQGTDGGKSEDGSKFTASRK